MALTKQQIYEEALRRAGIRTSSMPLTYPGLPETYNSYVSLIALPSGSEEIRSLIPHSQLARFEAEMHNIVSEEQQKQSAAKAAAVSLRNAKEEFEAMNLAEIKLFKEFILAKETKKREEEAAIAAAAALKAAKEAAAREEERFAAIQLFREMSNDWLRSLYSQSDNKIIWAAQQYQQGSLGWPHAFEKMWRDKRYTNRGLERVNYSMMEGQPWISQGKDGDGWPRRDEVDDEVHKMLDDEWKMYVNFCMRFAERISAK
jgi:hypothetical protein